MFLLGLFVGAVVGIGGMFAWIFWSQFQGHDYYYSDEREEAEQ